MTGGDENLVIKKQLGIMIMMRMEKILSKVSEMMNKILKKK